MPAGSRISVAGAIIVLTASLAPASAPAVRDANANVSVNILVGTTVRNSTIIPRGDTTTVKTLRFKAGVTVLNAGPDETTPRLRFNLPPGLRWGDDLPDASEHCTGTADSAECVTANPLDPKNTFTSPEGGWIWDIVADAPGTYVLRGELVDSSTPDPNASDNSSSVTVVVTRPALTASAVKLAPAKPRAGSVVSARVVVTAGGEAVAPTGGSCAGTIGTAKVTGTLRAAVGAATCLYRTPRSAAGKTLHGSVAFSANGTKITRRFAVKLR